MPYVDRAPTIAMQHLPGYLRARRRDTAKAVLLAHLAIVVSLGVLMLATEGPNAQGGGDSVPLAEAQLILVAAAWLGQVILIGLWARLALMLRQFPAARRPDGGGAIRLCMALTVIAAWVAEVTFLPVATYQVSNAGFGDPELVLPAVLLLLCLALASVTALVAACTRDTRPGMRYTSDV
jgi:hypothetical protein